MNWVYILLLAINLISGSVIAENFYPITPNTIKNTTSLDNTTPLNITITTKDPYSTEKNDGFLDLLLNEIGNRLGIEFNVLKNIPPARALFKLNEGTIDGDFPRVSGLEKIYPSIIYVPEKIVDYYFVAFSYEKCPHPISFNSMKESKVGFIRGWKIYEQKTKNYSQLVHQTAKSIQLYKLLDRKRIKYALHEHYIGNKFIADLMLENIIHECTPPLMIKPMYLYLNKKHRQLVPAISRVLKEIKQDGTYQRILDATLNTKHKALIK